MYLRKLESIMGVGICFVILIGLPGCVTPNKTNEGWMEYFDDNTNSDVVNASIEASDWLTNQDITIEDHLKRPVFVSWLDNGFTDPIIGGHPTVGDSYEKGIPPTSNFYIAKSEKEAVAVWIVRLLLEDLYNNGGSLSIPVKDILHKYLDDDKINDTVSWVENPTSSPSYNSPIGAKYDEELSKNYRVGDMFVQNALYHDITETLNSSLNDEDMTWLYHFLQESTQYSIRYFGTEGRDVDIFNRFGFFAEKSFVLNALKSNVNGHYYNPEDDFVKIYYTGYQINADGTPGSNARWSAEEYNKLTDEQKRYARITNTGAEYKDDYFNSMFYKTYIGTPPQTDSNGIKQMPSQQIPCYGMKHFFAEYISPYPYTSGFSAVVIAKYYEGAYINGTLQSNNTPLPYAQVIIFDKYGIPHDITYTNSSGVFHLIAPAGNITLTFSYNAGNGNQVLLKEITFNSMTNPLFAQISDADAMRLPGSNYNRILDLSVNLSTLEGYVYEDRNDNESYDPAIDTLIPGVTVQLEDQYFGRSILPTVTDTNGHYIFYNLFPSKYNASLIENGEVLATNDPFNVVPNYNFINISKP